MKPPKVPSELNAITDVVVRYRPKPKSKAAKKRKRREARLNAETGKDKEN
jgi:hypothetical protein